MLAVIYGLQALIFIMHGAFEMIGWLVIYIAAIPIFSLVLPLYSFWRMDEFGWGNTRIIQGEKGKRAPACSVLMRHTDKPLPGLVVHDEGKFDPREIPLRRWQE